MNIIKMICLAVCTVLVMSLAAPTEAEALTFTPTNGKDESGNPVPIYFYSQSLYMVSLDNGEALVDINSEEKLSPGYLTQLMTCALILDKFDGNEKKLRDTYISAGSDAYDELYDMGAPTADIRPFEEVSYYDILGSMIIASSCEAANIAALNMADSLFDFTLKMNERAKELGMENTKFSSAHGFSSVQNYTTAKDMSILCRYLVNNYQVFTDICGRETFQLEATDYHEEGTTLYNNNNIVNSYSPYYYSYADGIKSSTQDSSGRCLASYARYDGDSYLVISLNAPIEKTPSDVSKGEQDPESIYGDDYVIYSILDHIALYKWAFWSLISTDFINQNSEITDAYVEYGEDADYVNLKPSKSVEMMWPADLDTEQVKKNVTVYKNIIAPVEKGDVLGRMDIEYEGEIISSVDLVATSSVKRSDTKAQLKIASSFFRSNEFKWALFIIIMIVSVYGIGFFLFLQLKYMRINKKKK